MRKFLIFYVAGAIVWYFWSRSQGYVTSINSLAVWPITLFRQIRDKNATA